MQQLRTTSIFTFITKILSSSCAALSEGKKSDISINAIQYSFYFIVNFTSTALSETQFDKEKHYSI